MSYLVGFLAGLVCTYGTLSLGRFLRRPVLQWAVYLSASAFYAFGVTPALQAMLPGYSSLPAVGVGIAAGGALHLWQERRR